MSRRIVMRLWPSSVSAFGARFAQRLQAAAELLASLDGPADPGAEAAWAVEIKRRVAAIEAGTVTLEPWEDVRRRIEKEILDR